MALKSLPLDQSEFWKFALLGDDCWEWQGSMFPTGYGQYRGGRAHVVAYCIWNRKLPENNVLHSCDNRACIRPDHLRDGTQSENLKEAYKKGRKVPALAKLTWEQASEIRERYWTSEVTQGVLAVQYGVHQSIISELVNGKRWVH